MAIRRYNTPDRRSKLFGTVVAATASVGLLAVGAGSAAAVPPRHSAAHITLTEEDWWGTQPQYGAFNWLFSTYEKTHANVTIKRDVVPSTVLPNKVLSQAQTHTLPDIIVNDNPYVPEDAAAKAFVPLNSYIRKSHFPWSSYLPATRTITTVHGQIEGIQIGTNDLLIFYNKAIFAKAGITSLPQTWNQLYADAQKIKSSVKGLTYGAISFGAMCGAGWQFEPWLASAGAKLSITDITAPGTVAALSFWAKLVKNGLATKNVLSMCQTTNLPWLTEGKVAMIEDGTWDLVTLQKEHALPKVGFIKFPVENLSDKPSVPLGGEVWEIGATNPKAEQEAWNFVKWSQQPKILYQFDNKMDYLALRSPVYEEQAKANPTLVPFIQELQGGFSRTQYLPGNDYARYSTIVQDAIGKAILGEATPRAALEAAQKQMEA